MKVSRITWPGMLTILCGLCLIPVLFVPLWRIDLDAPQYPEGLKLLIRTNGLGGDVDIINGLNHYIGMKTLHSKDFIEFTLLPFIIGAFALAFIVAGIINTKRARRIMLIAFILFGIVAMADFWRWEYNYGHDLNPDAAIIVPGMAYQPPLIGFKQLLNFGAYSVPDIGGWIFIGVGLLLLSLVIVEWKRGSKGPGLVGTTTILSGMIMLSSCNYGPEPLRMGTDACAACKMQMSDPRYGAEIVTVKGKVYKFDDVTCMLSFRKGGGIKAADIKDEFIADMCGDHHLINLKEAILIRGGTIKGPMGGNVTACDNKDSAAVLMQRLNGQLITRTQLDVP